MKMTTRQRKEERIETKEKKTRRKRKISTMIFRKINKIQVHEI
jgi:hypothetical protein